MRTVWNGPMTWTPAYDLKFSVTSCRMMSRGFGAPLLASPPLSVACITTPRARTQARTTLGSACVVVPRRNGGPCGALSCRCWAERRAELCSGEVRAVVHGGAPLCDKGTTSLKREIEFLSMQVPYAGSWLEWLSAIRSSRFARAGPGRLDHGWWGGDLGDLRPTA